MQQYEIAVLYHPDLEIDLDKSAQKVTKIFTDNGGKVVAEDNWGKRKLAYTIKGHDHAVYVFYTVDLPAEGVRKVESTLNITDEVVRFLITKPDIKAKNKANKKAEAFKIARAKKQANRVEQKEEKEEDNE